jgi:hypothetical protein
VGVAIGDVLGKELVVCDRTSGHCHMEMEWIDRNRENKILIETNKEILIEIKAVSLKQLLSANCTNCEHRHCEE